MLRIFHPHRGDAIVVPGRGGRHWAQISTRPTRDVPVGDPAMGGHAGFALGLALARPADRVVLFDSEGDLLMSLGILATVAELAPANFYHFMLDNECYATTGGQPVPNAKNVAYDVIASGAGCSRRSRWCRRSRTSRSASGCAGRPAPATACWRTCAPSWASRGSPPMNAMDAMDAIDPVTLVVVQNGLQQVASEMDLTFERAAFSPVISEGFDRSDGIYARDNGDVIAQGELGLPIFVGVMQFTTRAVIEHVKERGADSLKPGDIFIINDPYAGGTHLMDVKMVKPFFYRGRLWAYLSNTGHWPDTGGSVPGGFSTRATEVQQEGLRLPPVKLFRQGVMQPDILSIILSNIRVPDERVGDIKAQVAALTVGEKRLTALLDRYGEATVTACIVELRRRSDLMMRAHIAKIPDGAYSGEAFVDSDGVDPDPLAIRLR